MLGYRDVGAEDLVDPRGRGPSFWFQQMDAPRPQRNRIYVDISVPHDQAEARVAAAIAAGGHLLTHQYAPAWWVLADAEENEACVATWMGRDQSASSLQGSAPRGHAGWGDCRCGLLGSIHDFRTDHPGSRMVARRVGVG